MLDNQMSSSQITETLLNAMKTIAQKEVSNLEFDITEKYIILRKSTDSQGKVCYIIEANGSEWEVYAKDGEEYYPNDVVLVHIPKNILTEKKYITGLVEEAKSKYYLPSSNFIPVVTLKEGTPNLQIGYESGFFSFEAKTYPEQFLLCDTIYLKFDIKTLQDIAQDYEFSVLLKYENGRTKTHSFSNNLFTGNVNSMYYSTQDISFDNILDFKKIQSISLKFIASKETSQNILSNIKIRNLELSIGKTASAQDSGVKIIPVKNSLSYNLYEDDFTRQLGLIWYNRNNEGDFIGFDTGIKIPLNDKGKPEWSSIVADEYEYTQEKNEWSKKKELYDLEYCPYDLQGLQYIQEIKTAETVLNNIIELINSAGASMHDYISNFNDVYQKMLQIADINKITDTSDKNLVNIIYSDLQKKRSDFQTKILEKKNSFFDISQTVNDYYMLWSNYIGTMFLNVRYMQELKENLNLSNLQMPQLLHNNEALNFSDIIKYLRDGLSSLIPYYENVSGIIYSDYNNFIQTFQNYEQGLINAGVISEKNTQSLTDLKSQLLDLTKKVQSIIKEEKLNEINKIFVEHNYLTYLDSSVDLPSYWYNSTYINTENYNEITGNYYNNYYYEYQYYINNNTFSDEQERLPNSLVLQVNAFNPVFVYSKETNDETNTLAIYWYQENIEQEEEDLLLQSNGWDLISKDWEYENYFPVYKVNSDHASLTKASPFNNMIQITLPDNRATTTVKVLLYYNHEQVGNSELTFINEGYEDIGFGSSLLDIEYLTEQYSLSNTEGFGVQVICYEQEDATKIIEPTQVLITEKTKKDIKSFPALEVYKMGVFSQERSYILTQDVLNSQKFFFEDRSENRFIPYGVIAFTLHSNEEDKNTAYLPISWSPVSKDLVLKGAKMISIKNNGEIKYDHYINVENSPEPYKLIGEKNIKIKNYEIQYLDNKLNITQGITVVKKLNGTEELLEGNALKVNQLSSGEYVLDVDLTKIRTCLKNFRPYLKITGTFGEDDENNFIFYQSLFILHESYDYCTHSFIDEIDILPTPKFTFIDPNEEALVKDIGEQTGNGEKGYTFLGIGTVEEKNWPSAKSALQHILNNSNETITNAYNFYFDNVRTLEHSRGIVPEKKWYEERLSQLNNKKEILLDTKSEMVYDRGAGTTKNKKQNIGSWIADLFTELYRFYEATKTDQKNFLSAVDLYYTDIQKILDLIKEDDT